MKNICVLTVIFVTLFISCSRDDDNNPLNLTSCNSGAEVITEENYNGITTSNYNVIDIQLNGDCLEVTISSSGCDPDTWEMSLFSVDAFYTVYPLERAIKIELVTEQLCQAVFQKTVSFDLTAFRIDGQNKVPLNIEEWDEQIVYEY